MSEKYKQEEIEQQILDFWKEKGIKEKTREKTKGNRKFYFVDGPPYLTGPPHMGQMRNKVQKDVMLRFKQMQGFDVWDQAGFDTHGLPNELATEKELEIDNKNAIGNEISVEEFINACKDRAVKAESVWYETMQNLAIWQDFDNPYLTYDKEYAESVWWLVQKASKRDMVYTAKKPIYWCPRCQTSLSGYEVTDEYQDIEDDSIFVKFPLKNRENEYFLIWTTTPWTIPSNLSILVSPDFRYARVKVNDEILIFAESLVDEVMDIAGFEPEDYEVVNTFSGSDLQGKAYEHPLEDKIPRQKVLEEEHQNVHRVLSAPSLVTLEEGTGLVHAATGHGEEDYEVTREYEVPVFSPVDKEGEYTEEGGDYEGMFVYDADSVIINDLEDKGVLFFNKKIEHEYPHCWRCKSKLIYRAADQWFLDIDVIKEKMIEQNEDVDWIPDSAYTRFKNWLEDSRDWCISRQSYWGVPLPIWVCDSCGQRQVIGSFEELEEKVGDLPEDFDPHKHVVDDLTWECDCGGQFKRIPDIVDVWFESGIASFAPLHYPFENKELLEEMYPMDYITEGSDQIRGWFYSLMFCGVMAFDEKPYDKVMLSAFVLDEDGNKMSKSEGNVIDPRDLLDQYGADLPRFYVLWTSSPWDNPRIDSDEIESEIYRLFSVYWNSVDFLRTYKPESLDKSFDNLDEDLEPIDRWILSRINKLVKKSAKNYDRNEHHHLTRGIEDFILNDLSRWYIKSVRKRVKSGDERALLTLEEVIKKLNLVMAPITPFITEKVYQDVFKEEIGEKSVHMVEFPQANQEIIDESLEEEMKLVKELISEINSLRQKVDLKLRWPAKKAIVSLSGEQDKNIDEFSSLIKNMANLKRLEFGKIETKLTAMPDYSSLGPRFKEDAEKVAVLIEDMEEDQVDQLRDLGKIELDGHLIKQEDVEFKEKAPKDISGSEFSQGKVFLDTSVSSDLKEEHMVQELIRNIQEERKKSGLNVSDKIDLYLSSQDVDVESLIEDWREEFESRISLNRIVSTDKKGEYSSKFEFEDKKLSFSFKLTD